MGRSLKVIHYLNQFFGGIGGEDFNDRPVEIVPGPVGPGRALTGILGSKGTVVATVIAGDNFFVEEQDKSLPPVREALLQYQPDLVVAGPAFDAGRYGLGCALVCELAGELDIPSVTGMVADNPGATSQGGLYVIETGSSPAEMVPALKKMAALGVKLAEGRPPGPAHEEGYVPTGVRKPMTRPKTGAGRAVDMVLGRINGAPVVSEISIRQYDQVDAPPPLGSLSNSTVALVTTAGLVPRGNPDGQSHGLPRRWLGYNIDGIDSLTVAGWESVHTGFKGHIYNTLNPNYALPLPALRTLEAMGEIGRLHNRFYSVVGGACPVGDARRMGGEIAQDLNESGVEAVILEST